MTDRGVVVDALTDANAAYRESLEALRDYRNTLLVLAGVLTVLSGLVPLLAYSVGDRFARLGQGVPNDWEPFATVALWGAAGGALGALVALRRLRQPDGPFGVHVAQAILRVPAGAFVALVLTVVVQAEVIDQIKPIPAGSLGAYAVLFGYAQEAATRLVDRRASQLIDEASSATPAQISGA